MRNIFLIVLALAVFGFAQQTSTVIYGEADNKVLTFTQVTGTSMASAAVTGSPADNLFWEIRVASLTGTIGRIEYFDILKNRRYQKFISPSATDAVTISGITITYAATLVAGDFATVKYTDMFPAKIDTVGGLWIARWDSCYVDTVTTVSATPDTIELTRDFPEGLTVVTSHNLQFRTNRITGWIMLAAGTNIFIPIRHTTNDTCFVKTISSVPDFTLVRGK